MVDRRADDSETSAFEESVADDVEALVVDDEPAPSESLAFKTEAAAQEEPKLAVGTVESHTSDRFDEVAPPHDGEDGVQDTPAEPSEEVLGPPGESEIDGTDTAAEEQEEDSAGEAADLGARLREERGEDVRVSPAGDGRRRTLRLLVRLAAATVIAVAFALGAAFVAWPHAGLGATQDALARIDLPGFAGQVTAVGVYSASGTPVPVRLRQGQLWPRSQLIAGEPLTVEVTVLRPTWVSWLVGRRQVSRFTIMTPSAHLRARWLRVKSGTPVSVSFDAPVQVVQLGGSPARRLASPQTTVTVGIVADRADSAGQITVAAAARPWERLSAPTSVTWFAARPYPQVLVDPAVTAVLAPGGPLTLTFSDSIKAVLGGARPTISPAVPGRWQALDTHTLTFRPGGQGYGMGTVEHVHLPVAVHVAGDTGAVLTRELRWQVGRASMLRLQQLLAQLGYLPLDWQPAGSLVASSTAAQVSAAVSPPSGRFSWQYPTTPAELRALWHPGRLDKITYGAVMVFEDTHGLAADGLAGPTVWSKVIADAVAGRRHKGGYSYVFVHSQLPQSLNLWHGGRVIVTSPGNTGIPSAPTQLGTFPVFEHIPVGTMSGTNPSGSHYNDPGIRYISYFNGGDAIHAFNRASFGTPQSLGCVELPLAAAAEVWPYTPIGTLVTIEK